MVRSHFPLAIALVCGTTISLNAAALAQPSDKQPASQTKTDAVAKPAGPSKIERYAKVLDLDKTQTDAARDLYTAYQKETAAAGKKLRETMKDAQEDMNAGDRAEFEKRVQKTMGDHSEQLKKLTDSFLSDLKDLLRADQQPRWADFERYRRREKLLSSGSAVSFNTIGVGGSSVDLFPIIEKLGVPADVKKPVDEILGRYALDIDHPLQEREQNLEDDRSQMGAVQHFDGASFQKKLDRDRKVDLAIREMNTRYVREIAALLPEDLAKKLNESYQARAYRSIYKDSNISKKIASAEKVKDLTDDQRAKLRTLADSYRRDAKAANDRWAAAQQRAETEGRPTGTGLMMIGPGDSGAEKVDPALAEARSNRRSLDDGARGQLEKILTPEQLADLPDPTMYRGGGMMAKRVAVFGDGTGDHMVITDDLDLDDDAGPTAEGGMMIIRTVKTAMPHGGGGGEGGGGQPAPPAQKP